MGVELIKYDPEWEALFKREAKKIKTLLGKKCCAVCHVGSTAVKGLHARPIIDIMAVVECFSPIEEAKEKLFNLGYQIVPEETDESTRMFVKGGAVAFKLVVFEKKNEAEIARRIALRNYLRVHRDDAVKYDVLRRTLLESGVDFRTYQEKRAIFLAELEPTALLWQKRQDRHFNHLLSGILISMGLGSLLSIAFADFAIGMCLGLCVGVSIGFGMAFLDKR